MIEQNEEFRHTFSFTQEDVIKFAEVTGDKNPLHLDADYAAKTPFSQPIMHGFLAGSVFSKIFGIIILKYKYIHIYIYYVYSFILNFF